MRKIGKMLSRQALIKWGAMMEGGRFCVSLMLLFKKERLKVIKKFIIISVHYNVKMCMNLFHYLFFCPEIFVNI